MTRFHDRTAEVKTSTGELKVGRSDCCDAFKQDTARLFYCQECWYCKYGDFGLFTERPTENGLCRYKGK